MTVRAVSSSRGCEAEVRRERVQVMRTKSYFLHI